MKTKTNENDNPRLIGSSDLLAVAEWLTGEDTGISSKYMAAVAICGKVIKSRWIDPTPSDAPDLGRCVRLVEKCPAIRETFPVLRHASKVWAAHLDHWDELVALYKQGNYTRTTARMRELRASANTEKGTWIYGN